MKQENCDLCNRILDYSKGEIGYVKAPLVEKGYYALHHECIRKVVEICIDGIPRSTDRRKALGIIT